MGEILGVGLTHYGSFCYPDENMHDLLRRALNNPRIPAEAKDPANWPEQARQEFGLEGENAVASAAKHRAAVMGATLKARDAIDAFKPDLVLIWGDDQYENFREDVVPPFCVYILDKVEDQPFLRTASYRLSDPQNVWGYPKDHVLTIRGHREGARDLARGLLESGFDVPYAYATHHIKGLAHAFRNSVLYLDYDKRGFPYPVVPFHVNCYGSSLIRNRGGGGAEAEAAGREFDPPAPSPRRCFELGAAIARILRASPWRAVLVGSSSWSHAFLTKKTHYMWPDVASDQARFEELRDGQFHLWRDLKLAQLEDAGQHEFLNWVCLAGAMTELGQKAQVLVFENRYTFNSSKTVAVFPSTAAGAGK
jgi:hypothetical protein